MTEGAPPEGEEPGHESERPPSGSWQGQAIAVLLAVGLVVGVIWLFPALAAGDGAVGVSSATLPITEAQDADGATVTLVGHQPGGVFTIGFPLRNRGLVPVTVTGIAPVSEGGGQPTSVGACEDWQVADVRTRREAPALPAGAVREFGSVPVGPGDTVQLYVEAAFPDVDCDAAVEDFTRHGMVVEHKALNLLPRRQTIPFVWPVVAASPEDPRLGSEGTAGP